MESNKKGNTKNVKKKATVCLPSNNLSKKVHNIGICNKSHARLEHVPLLLYEADVEQMRKRKIERDVNMACSSQTYFTNSPLTRRRRPAFSSCHRDETKWRGERI
jgi:hypothetical protein